MTSSATRDFNGSSDYLDSGSSTDYAVGSGTTISIGCWINSDTALASRGICGDAVVINGWYFGIVGSNQIGISIGTITSLQSGFGITADQWNYVGIGWQAGTGYNAIKIDSSGSITTGSNSGTSVPNSNAGTTFKVGQKGASDLYFDGEIAHVQVWNRRLSNDELILSGFRPGSIGNGLLSYWPIYGQRSPETDLGSLQNHATVTGTTASSGAIPLCIPTS